MDDIVKPNPITGELNGQRISSPGIKKVAVVKGIFFSHQYHWHCQVSVEFKYLEKVECMYDMLKQWHSEKFDEKKTVDKQSCETSSKYPLHWHDAVCEVLVPWIFN